jgi:hypothetical protein
MLVHWNPGKHFIHFIIYSAIWKKNYGLCFVCVDNKKPLDKAKIGPGISICPTDTKENAKSLPKNLKKKSFDN